MMSLTRYAPADLGARKRTSHLARSDVARSDDSLGFPRLSQQG